MSLVSVWVCLWVGVFMREREGSRKRDREKEREREMSVEWKQKPAQYKVKSIPRPYLCSRSNNIRILECFS